MSRSFTAASTQSLNTAGTPLSDAPFTVSAWVYLNATSISQGIFCLGKLGVTQRHLVYITNANRASIFSGNGGTTGEATTSAGSPLSGSTWHHIVGIVSATNARSIQANALTASNTTNVTGITGLDRTVIGAYYNSGFQAGFYASANIAEMGVWSAALSADEIDQLQAGYSPAMIRPQLLAAYWPMFGRGGSGAGEEDWIGGVTLGQTNSPTVADHPRIIYPKRQIWVPKGSAAGSFTSTGALAAQAATVAGTATHLTLHTATGALEAQAATVSGAAVHPHIATGALEAGSAEVAGTASLTSAGSFTSTGALSAQAATVEGTATHLTLHTSSGALSAQAATVAGEATHYTLHTAEGALEAGSASISGTAVDESTYVAPVSSPGGGKSRKTRKRRIQVEIDGEVFDVDSAEEAEAVLANVAQKATETAKLAIERASKAKRKPVRAIIRDAEKALQIPEISVPEKLQSYADQMIGKIRAEYESAMSAIGIAAHMAKREREIEEDDEEVLMLL